MEDYTITTDIELADVQQTADVLEEKLDFWRANYPYARKEIKDMEIALRVLWDLTYDVADRNLVR